MMMPANPQGPHQNNKPSPQAGRARVLIQCMQSHSPRQDLCCYADTLLPATNLVYTFKRLCSGRKAQASPLSRATARQRSWLGLPANISSRLTPSSFSTASSL